MKLIHTHNGKEVKIGDIVTLDGLDYEVTYFAKPHKPSSSGRISIHLCNAGCMDEEYYVGVVGCQWIEREDQ